MSAAGVTRSGPGEKSGGGGTTRRGGGGGGSGASEATDPSQEDYIPPEWGRESKQVRVVEAGSKNEFQFDIKGK